LLHQGAIHHGRRGQPRRNPRALVGDKAYNSGAFRACLRRRHIRAVIPRFCSERRVARFDRAAYRERNRVERLINRLKQYRRIATRYEKCADNYLAMLQLGGALLWLKFANTP
jgi:transposase